MAENTDEFIGPVVYRGRKKKKMDLKKTAACNLQISNEQPEANTSRHMSHKADTGLIDDNNNTDDDDYDDYVPDAQSPRHNKRKKKKGQGIERRYVEQENRKLVSKNFGLLRDVLPNKENLKNRASTLLEAVKYIQSLENQNTKNTDEEKPQQKLTQSSKIKHIDEEKGEESKELSIPVEKKKSKILNAKNKTVKSKVSNKKKEPFHGNSLAVACGFCTKEVFLDKMSDHFEHQHHTKSHCTWCLKNLHNEKLLQKHVHTKHDYNDDDDTTTYYCPHQDCEYSIGKRHKVIRHIRTSHWGEVHK